LTVSSSEKGRSFPLASGTPLVSEKDAVVFIQGFLVPLFGVMRHQMASVSSASRSMPEERPNTMRR